MRFANLSYANFKNVNFQDTNLTRSLIHMIQLENSSINQAICIGMQKTDKELAEAESWRADKTVDKGEK